MSAAITATNNTESTTTNCNNSNSTVCTSKNNSQSHFYPITKSVSVPDIHQNPEDTIRPVSNQNKCLRPAELNNLLVTNSGSIESAIADSPAGSINEQFEANVNTPLSTDDAVDSITDTLRESQTNSHNSSFSSVLPNNSMQSSKQYDSNSPSFRFRRHSSQSAINVNSSLPTCSSGINSTSERICSSPINSLKMSSRVCQIKIDEGIEPHLSREIKSERDANSTIKLKTSCDELMLNSDDLSLEAFETNRTTNETNRTNSPISAAIISSVASFRQNSQSNMPSPSMSSCYSYSNSSSPTAGVSTNNNNPGLLRCFSPSTTLTVGNSSAANNVTINQNYFSQSPSPTRKLFVTRRSMSPIQLRPSSLSGASNLNKRKLSDLDPSDSSQMSLCSPKRSNTDNTQEFVQPLQIFTGTSNLQRPIGTVRSLASSPFSSLATSSSSSPNQSSISSLIITSSSTSSSNNFTPGENRPDSNLKSSSMDSSFKAGNTSQLNESNTISNSATNNSLSGPKFLWPSTVQSQQQANNNKNEETNSNKYTFKPIQLPHPSTISNGNQQRPRRFINASASTSTATSFTTIIQQNQLNSNNSPLNSPAHYLCDSPISYSPSVSIISSSTVGEKPDSGYQSSIQNNSDSESCI